MYASKLKEVDEYNIPIYLLERVAKQHGYSLEYTKELGKEAKRMLYLTVLSKEPVVPSHHVDMVWHEMLVFSRWYMNFCKFLGTDYIHHDPEKPADLQVKTTMIQKFKNSVKEKWIGPDPYVEPVAYTKTKENYEKYFGEKPSNQYWV